MASTQYPSVLDMFIFTGKSGGNSSPREGASVLQTTSEGFIFMVKHVESMSKAVGEGNHGSSVESQAPAFILNLHMSVPFGGNDGNYHRHQIWNGVFDMR